MDSIISNSIDTLSNFLSDIETKLKQNHLNTALISVSVPTDFTFSGKLNQFIKYFERSFFLEKQDESFSLLGIDEAVSIAENGESRFALTEKKIKELKKSFISNWSDFPKKNFPLFIGGFKFTPERSEAEWQDYSDSNWFIPEIMFLSNSSGNFILMNFVFSLGVSKDFVLNKFKSKLTKLTEVKNNTKINNITQIINYEGTSPKDKKKWKNLVAEVLEKIKENQIEKVVLSRKVELKLSGEPNIDDLIDSLKKDYPTCYIFIFHKGKSSFFGATPEKLAKFTDGKIEIDALAGSAPRGKNPDEDLMLENKLLADRKNLNEHNIVVEHIKNSISGITNNLNLDTHYGIKKLANIQHLWSKFSAELKNSSSIFSIIKELYPTPAICGFPKDTALHLIKRVEGYKRGLYSGVIGWFNFENDGDFAVALRSALYANNKLYVYAGSGIVENSNPEEEYKETELKLNTILSLFVDENKN